MHRSQRTGLAIWPTIRSSTSWPSRTTWPSRLEMTAVRGSCRRRRRGQRREVADGGRHVLGVERAGDAQRDQPGLGGRLRGERLELLERAGGDDLAGAVVVGGGQAVLVEGRRAPRRGRRRGRRSCRSGSTADASAIALPRSRTSTIACSAVIAPDGAGRGRARRRCARRRRRPRRRRRLGREQPRAVTRPVATSSGWAIWVSRMVSASASVP